MRRILALAIRSARALLMPWRGPLLLEYRLEYVRADRINPNEFRMAIPRSYKPRSSDYPF